MDNGSATVSFLIAIFTYYLFVIKELDNSNAEEYLALAKHFMLEAGIRKQLESFKGMAIVMLL